MVDRGRSPIRTDPSLPAPAESASARAAAQRKATVETSPLDASELERLFVEDEPEIGSSTVRLEASELDDLLARARPAMPSAPESRPLLATLPYDEVTARALLGEGPEPEDPPLDALEEEAADLDDADLDEASSDVEPTHVDAEGTPCAIVVASDPFLVVPPAVESAPALELPAPAKAPSTRPAAPLPSAAPAARASLPSEGVEWPGAQDRKRRAITIVAVGAAVAAIAILYFSMAEAEPPPAVALVQPTAEAPAPRLEAPAAQGPSPAEVEARAALARLREGIGECVRHAIGSLPGSSPAVPPALKLAAGAGYSAAPADWKTAVWSCARFHHDSPMRFQLQWQSVKPGTEALGIAWIDDDADGDADRAFGFRATAKGVRDVDLGEVAPMEMRPVLPVR